MSLEENTRFQTVLVISQRLSWYYVVSPPPRPLLLLVTPTCHLRAYSYQVEMAAKTKKIKEQECIPVGCIPPAHYHTGGSPWDPPGQRPPWTSRDPPNRDPPPLDRDPPPPDRDPSGQKLPRTETHPWKQIPPGQRPAVQGPRCTETPWTENPWSCDLWYMLGQRPPVNRMTDRQMRAVKIEE